MHGRSRSARTMPSPTDEVVLDEVELGLAARREVDPVGVGDPDDAVVDLDLHRGRGSGHGPTVVAPARPVRGTRLAPGSAGPVGSLGCLGEGGGGSALGPVIDAVVQRTSACAPTVLSPTAATRAPVEPEENHHVRDQAARRVPQRVRQGRRPPDPPREPGPRGPVRPRHRAGPHHPAGPRHRCWRSSTAAPTRCCRSSSSGSLAARPAQAGPARSHQGLPRAPRPHHRPQGREGHRRRARPRHRRRRTGHPRDPRERDPLARGRGHPHPRGHRGLDRGRPGRHPDPGEGPGSCPAARRCTPTRTCSSST